MEREIRKITDVALSFIDSRDVLVAARKDVALTLPGSSEGYFCDLCNEEVRISLEGQSAVNIKKVKILCSVCVVSLVEQDNN